MMRGTSLFGRTIDQRNEGIVRALRLYSLGNFQYALDEINRTEIAPHEQDFVSSLTLTIAAALSRKHAYGETVLVWQYSPTAWEGDWLHYLLNGLYHKEIDDRHHSVILPNMIVVDNLLTPEKEAYFKKAFEGGCNIFLIHLSDEHYADDCSSYRWCSKVYRNYWSPILDEFRRVTAFPLGTKLGMKIDQAVKPCFDRKWRWGFAGDWSKSSRLDMHHCMTQVEGGNLHTASGFDSSDALGTEAYQSFLGDCVFAPCPNGSVNIETFRTYEALECGAIPIVECRPNFDYYRRLLGPYPFLKVNRWDEAPKLIASLIRDNAVEDLQNKCVRWWQQKKLSLKASIIADLDLQNIV